MSKRCVTLKNIKSMHVASQIQWYWKYMYHISYIATYEFPAILKGSLAYVHVSDIIRIFFGSVRSSQVWKHVFIIYVTGFWKTDRNVTLGHLNTGVNIRPIPPI